MPSHIICVSSPEGVGKDTLLRPMLDLFPELTLGRKATTRARRDDDYDERLGCDKYSYLSEDEFMQQRAAGRIVEHSRNANGCLYGSQIDLSSHDVELRDIDVNGALQLAAKSRLQAGFPQVTLVGVLPPHNRSTLVLDVRKVLIQASTSTDWSFPIATLGANLFIAEMLANLEKRLIRRGDSQQLREQKLARAAWEVPEIIQTWPHVIVNDNLDLALTEMSLIIEAVLSDALDCVRFRAYSS